MVVSNKFTVVSWIATLGTEHQCGQRGYGRPHRPSYCYWSGNQCSTDFLDHMDIASVYPQEGCLVGGSLLSSNVKLNTKLKTFHKLDKQMASQQEANTDKQLLHLIQAVYQCCGLAPT